MVFGGWRRRGRGYLVCKEYYNRDRVHRGLDGAPPNEKGDFANQHNRAGPSLETAVERAGVVRFRPVMLTSLTTFIGLAPLLLERSTTAQFLIPMAISLGFGILFATFITLILVPTNILVANDFGKRMRRFVGKPVPADAVGNA